MDPTTIAPGQAHAFRLAPGNLFRIIDVEGQQACELVAICADDAGEYLDCSATMEAVGRLFPTEKSKFYSNRYEPMFTLLEDKVACHDLLQPGTSSRSRQHFLGESGERNGSLEWTQAALAGVGMEGVFIPRPAHFFRRTDVDDEGNFAMMETPSNAGDYALLQCERDLVAVLAVPDDEISPTTGCNPTPIRVEFA